jgi:hypothetical protein
MKNSWAAAPIFASEPSDRSTAVQLTVPQLDPLGFTAT